MIRHIIQKCVTLALTLGYILCVAYCQNLPNNVIVDIVTLLCMGLWLYIILDDFDVKTLKEHRLLTSKHVIYEVLFIVSLALITGAYCIKRSFAWGLTMLIASIVTFIGGCVMYVYYFRKEDEFVSTEIENCQHIKFVLVHLKNKTEEWTADKLEEYATKAFRFYPKNNHLERTLDGFDAVDITGNHRTLAEMNADDPNSAEAVLARKRIKEIVVDYVARKAAKEQKKLQKKQKKEAKA